MPQKQKLGEILVQQNLVTPEIVAQALRIQVGGNRRLGHILVQMKVISADQLAETLANQLNIPICDIAEKFSRNAEKIIPRYLCRQYCILPLALKDNNILEVAMADPCDHEAINNMEHYTGMVIQPLLARHSDIDQEIPKRVPFGLKDLFSPRFNTKLTRIGVAVCLALVILLAVFTYQYIHNATYGTVTTTEDSKLYKNLDLLLGIDNNGTFNLLGRGAYAKGFYAVSFKNKEELQAFLNKRQADFSEKQKTWLAWAIAQKIPYKSTKPVAASQ